VLFVGLIMLLMVTLIAIASVRMASTNVQIVGNEQFRHEADAAAAFALDKLINDANYLDNYPPDVDTLVSVAVGQAAHDVTIKGGVKCKRARRVPSAELTASPQDLPCIQGQGSSPLTIVGGGGGGGGSLCANVLWEVRAEVAPEQVSGATTAMTQGLEARVSLPDAVSLCD
jgi:hypothetical protein